MAQTPVTNNPVPLYSVLERSLSGAQLGAEDGDVLMSAQGKDLQEVLSAAKYLNDSVRTHGRVTYSRKLFIPLTNLCRDRCGYCTFVHSPHQAGAHTMTPEEVLKVAHEAKALGCKEALFSLGDHPEWRHTQMKSTLQSFGYSSTPEYVADMCKLVLEETGILPHTNCGLLDRDELELVSAHNASMGLMLENVSPRLLERGGPHFGAESKRPELRIGMLEMAGKMNVVMTTGILIGIGETAQERVASLLAIRSLQERYGNIQEVIIQNFRAKLNTRMRNFAEPVTGDMIRTLAVARLLLGPEMNIQAPPNLNENYAEYLQAGINDWGGISPLTADFINPEAPWPELINLRKVTRRAGYRLHERLALYPEYVKSHQGYLSERVSHRVNELSGPDGYIKSELEQW